MNINNYLEKLLADESNIYTQSWLEVPAYLSGQFESITEASESEVKEKGAHLLWLNNELKMEHKSTQDIKVYSGQHDSIEMNTQAIYTSSDYIGNYHNHPYQKKYHALAAIGPSSGDWEHWVKFFPTQKSCSVRFVSSGPELFLVVFRKKPPQLLTGTKITEEVTRHLNFTWNDDEPAKKYRAFYFAEEYKQSGDVLGQFFPNAAKFHDADVESMNIELADLNECEYYRGTLNSRGPTYLYLKSRRILGSWLKVKFWTQANEPWIHKRLF